MEQPSYIRQFKVNTDLQKALSHQPQNIWLIFCLASVFQQAHHQTYAQRLPILLHDIILKSHSRGNSMSDIIISDDKNVKAQKHHTSLLENENKILSF